MQTIILYNSAFSAEKKLFICNVILHGGMLLILQLQLYQSVVKKLNAKLHSKHNLLIPQKSHYSQRPWPILKETMSQNEHLQHCISVFTKVLKTLQDIRSGKLTVFTRLRTSLPDQKNTYNNNAESEF